MGKRILSLFLLLGIVLSLSGCGQSSAEAFENTMGLLREGDLNEFSDALSDESELTVKAAAGIFESMSEASRQSVLKILSKLKVTVRKEESSDERLTVKITGVDFDLLASYLENVDAIGGNRNKNAMLTELSESGRMDSLFLKTATVAVTMVRGENGAWQIPYTLSQNKELVEFINLSIWVRFFSK